MQLGPRVKWRFLRLSSRILPCSNTQMNQPGIVFALLILGSAHLVSQTNPPAANQTENYSGMYMFLRDGEFIQISVEDAGNVTGFVSRYGDDESDRGAFLNQFFKTGKLQGTQLTFVTQVVHGVWFEFKGRVTRGPGKTPQDEAYYVLEGTLTESREGLDNKVSSTSRQVRFKSFPKDTQTTHSQPARDSGRTFQQASSSRLSFRPLRLPSTVTAIDSV
jgi:hypothetical protein